MIINNHAAIASIYSTNVATGTRRSNGLERSAEARDEIHLSREAQSFHQIFGAMRDTSEVRPEKIAAYSAQVADGSYHVSAANIAASLLGNRF